MSGGDDIWIHSRYGHVHANYDLATGIAGPVDNLLAVKSANHQIYIMHIVVSVTTFANKVLTFQDDAGTPVVIGKIEVPTTQPTSVPGEQTYVLNFLGEGIPLTVGKNLDLTLSAAGVGAKIHVEAYQRLVGPVTVAQAAVGG